MVKPIMDDRFHHVREGEQYNAKDEQLVWCPNVREWMTRAEHRRRFRFDEES